MSNELQPPVQCPRCRAWRNRDFFPWPVTLCLICYSMQPGNEGLNEKQLRVKATRSRFARRRSHTNKRKHRELELLTTPTPHMEETEVCTECKARFDPSDLYNGICIECRAE